MKTEQCKADVYPNETFGWAHPHQCHKKAVKDGYCTIHHPDYIKARHEMLSKKWNEESKRIIARSNLQSAAVALLNALENLLMVIHDDELIPESVSYMKAARAAVAKAKGESK